MTTMTQMMTTLSTLRYPGLKGGGLGPGILGLREGEMCIPGSEEEMGPEILWEDESWP